MEENENLRRSNLLSSFSQDLIRQAETAPPADSEALQLSLTNHLDLFRNLLEEKEDEIFYLEDRLKNSEEEKSSLLEKQAKQFNSQIRLFRELLEEKDEEVEQKNEELKIEKRSFKELESEIQVQESTILSTKNHVKLLFQKAQELSKITDEKAAFLENQNKEKEALENKLQSAVKKNESCGKKLLQAKGEKTKLKEELESLKNQLAKIKEDKRLSEERSLQRTKKISEMKEIELQKLKSENKRLKCSLESEQEGAERLEERFADEEMKINQQREKMNELASKLQKMEALLTAKKTVKKDLEVFPVLINSGKDEMKEKILEKFKFERERRVDAEKELRNCEAKRIEYERFCLRFLRSTGIGIRLSRNFGLEELMRNFIMNDFL
ncbi:Oidioi.mRNA.OKI2018_I69.chr2.g5374.t1.cds [Oikopleura dioica]|uniref:Oidioi.mRNA.OKI2018_I69.chr2.g5374.t1.cds n=1 Tax=Oikopleura dioica TaxID=34765 RepID=A0ABN7T3T1_OIKDI|nr:Oidioi.mRNA.OKI2018_I69.chr2.g5374.t1.cds [Oikopleura dioica]